MRLGITYRGLASIDTHRLPDMGMKTEDLTSRNVSQIPSFTAEIHRSLNSAPPLHPRYQPPSTRHRNQAKSLTRHHIRQFGYFIPESHRGQTLTQPSSPHDYPTSESHRRHRLPLLSSSHSRYQSPFTQHGNEDRRYQRFSLRATPGNLPLTADIHHDLLPVTPLHDHTATRLRNPTDAADLTTSDSASLFSIRQSHDISHRLPSTLPSPASHTLDKSTNIRPWNNNHNLTLFVSR